MNISLVIDQLVLEGMPLSRGERVALEESLRESLTQVLNERVAAHALPEGRRARREQMLVSLSGNTGGAGFGKSLGALLGSHVWGGQVALLDGQGGRQ